MNSLAKRFARGTRDRWKLYTMPFPSYIYRAWGSKEVDWKGGGLKLSYGGGKSQRRKQWKGPEYLYQLFDILPKQTTCETKK